MSKQCDWRVRVTHNVIMSHMVRSLIVLVEHKHIQPGKSHGHTTRMSKQSDWRVRVTHRVTNGEVADYVSRTHLRGDWPTGQARQLARLGTWNNSIWLYKYTYVNYFSKFHQS